MTDHLYCGKCKWLRGGTQRYCDQCGHDRGMAPRPFRVHYGPVVEQHCRIPPRVEGLLEQYALIDRLGAGGMGVVYRALDPRSGQPFAIKVLGPKFRARGQGLDILRQEAEAQRAIIHPNVVRLFEFVHNARNIAIVMELVDGMSLQDKLVERRGRPLSKLQFVWLAREITIGLGVVHDHGYVHADVKPANFLYGQSEQGHSVLKVSDFGIARKLDSGRRIVAGTYGYMSPEQVRGDPLTAASDLYGLGCVLYEVLTGGPVFPVTDTQELAQAHCTRPPPKVDEALAGPYVSSLIDALLRKEPHMRPQSADIVRQVLEGIT